MDPAREGEDPHPLGPRSITTMIRIFIGFTGFLLPFAGLDSFHPVTLFGQGSDLEHLSPELLLSRPYGHPEPVFLRGKRAGIFLIELAERIVRPVEVDQDPSIRHRFDVQIASLPVGLLARRLISKGEKELPSTERFVDLKKVLFPHQLELERTVFDIFLARPLARRKGYVERLGFGRVGSERPDHRIAKVDRVVR